MSNSQDSLYGCQDPDGDWIKAVAGGAGVCYSYNGLYSPNTLPSDKNTFTNTVNAKATSPAEPGGLGDLTNIGESAVVTCTLCPCVDCEQ